jgi:hypothetical protein
MWSVKVSDKHSSLFWRKQVQKKEFNKIWFFYKSFVQNKFSLTASLRTFRPCYQWKLVTNTIDYCCEGKKYRNKSLIKFGPIKSFVQNKFSLTASLRTFRPCYHWKLATNIIAYCWEGKKYRNKSLIKFGPIKSFVQNKFLLTASLRTFRPCYQWKLWWTF